MEGKKSVILNTLLRIICMIVSGILISLMLLVNIDTSSWFSGEAKSSLDLKTATKDDIINKFEIIQDESGNSIGVKIEKSQVLDKEATFYFSIEGEAAKYILHINPILLGSNIDVNKAYPIKLNINLGQWIRLIKEKPLGSIVQGTIKLNYLNNYITDEVRQIQFSREYLIDCFMQQIENDSNKHGKGYKEDNESSYIAQATRVIAGYGKWDEASYQNTAVYGVAMKEINQYEEDIKSNPLSKLELTDDQQSIIDIITPGLKQYIDTAYNTIESLISQLNDKKKEITEKNSEIEQLKQEITKQQDINQKLLAENNKLMDENQSLTNELISKNNTIDDMNRYIKELEKQKLNLEDYRNQLENDKFKLAQRDNYLESRVKELEQSINELNKEIKQLNDLIDKLQSGSVQQSGTGK